MGIFKFVSKQEGFQTGLTEKFEQEVLFFKEKLLFWRKTCYNIFADKNCGELAQLGERMVRNHEVRGSIPLFSTTHSGGGVCRRFFLMGSWRNG